MPKHRNLISIFHHPKLNFAYLPSSNHIFFPLTFASILLPSLFFHPLYCILNHKLLRARRRGGGGRNECGVWGGGERGWATASLVWRWREVRRGAGEHSQVREQDKAQQLEKEGTDEWHKGCWRQLVKYINIVNIDITPKTKTHMP